MTIEDDARVRAKGLFGLAPEGFIEARDALARQLAEDREPVLAAAIKKLRKPTVVAWAVNAASRKRPADVAALLRAGDDLQQAQVAAISGKGAGDLRNATQARRAKVAALAEVALGALGARAGAHRDAIVLTLEAASVDPELGGRLREGTLEREATPDSGLGPAGGFQLLQGGDRAGEDDATEEDRKREAKEAERTAVVAEREAERAARRAEQLRAKARDASASAEAAEAEARRLADEAKTLRRRAART
ncbi:MAG: hypothetical protein E6G58_07845 [Actinobacteria bacterium]|nr:MAG: hypothetical protein E6G58_07845 [Actinomycetota bacterium]